MALMLQLAMALETVLKQAQYLEWAWQQQWWTHAALHAGRSAGVGESSSSPEAEPAAGASRGLTGRGSSASAPAPSVKLGAGCSAGGKE